MTGLNMLLSAMGITPEAIETAKKDIQSFATEIKSKVESMDARLASIEATQAEILAMQKKLADDMANDADYLRIVDESDGQFPRPQTEVAHAG